MTSSDNLTKLLVAWGDGDDAALRELTPLVEVELRRLAARYMVTSAPATPFRRPPS